MCKRAIYEISGENRVFRDLKDASIAFGVHYVTVSRWISDGRKVRYVKRVYAVRVDNGVLWDWVPCEYDCRRRRYVRMDGNGFVDPPVYKNWVKDITSEWYSGTEFASGADFKIKK